MPISVSKFSDFLVQILCFTSEEIEAWGLGGLSDFFNGTCQKKQNRKKSRTSNTWSGVFYFTPHCHQWF